jgi:hypothetical protein
VTERELQALLDTRPDPAAAERLIERSPTRRCRAARRLIALARAAALPEPAPSSGFVERTVARLASVDPPRRRAWRWPLAPRRSPWPTAILAALAQRLAPRARSRRR